LKGGLKFVLLGEKIDGEMQIECPIDDEFVDFVEALNVASTRCNLKWSPLAGMLVQGISKLLRITMIGMNMCFKGLCEVKHICV
jgi:hypothetical protein